jgi:toxin FitB
VTDVLVDTDVLIDHLRGAARFDASGLTIHYSTVTRCELFCGPADQEAGIMRLLAPFRELAVDRPVAERAGRIQRETGLLTPDALIAATALVHGLELLSRNRRDFDRVPGLVVR